MGFVWLASQETNAITGDQITLFRQPSDNRDALGISLTALVWFVTTVHLVLGINGDKGLELPGAEISCGLEPVCFEGKTILSWVFISISTLLDFSSKLKSSFFPEYHYIHSKVLAVIIALKKKKVTNSLFPLTRSISLYLWKWFWGKFTYNLVYYFASLNILIYYRLTSKHLMILCY